MQVKKVSDFSGGHLPSYWPSMEWLNDFDKKGGLSQDMMSIENRLAISL